MSTRRIKERHFSGTTDPTVPEWEIKHRAVARRAAADGIVLLKNENHVLPIDINCPVALYGAGASHTIKGGTGSGDVNERECVSIYQGMKNADIILHRKDGSRNMTASTMWQDATGEIK